ncbi:succinylglutamate desuccinylase/aspartoacylase family protein [Parahaliea mediterranea]|uniref:Succinylglutamate desuccinylase/aspartoacylase family protein n=2 Tax=Parahaliea mediterranea TaxID=651086 RepID=A0A939DED7_9GAMM|nr:succinylglutamate desuccinylase/aspartoacylase family protein [Parahaliea mediterranea]
MAAFAHASDPTGTSSPEPPANTTTASQRESGPENPSGGADDLASRARGTGEDAGEASPAEVRKARNVALDQPISSEEASRPASEPADPNSAAPASAAAAEADREAPTTEAQEDVAEPAADAGAAEQPPAPAEAASPTPATEADDDGPDSPAPFVLLGTEVPPATSTRLAWAPSQSFEGIYSATPVLVVNGAEPGPTLCLTAAVHGDELNGVETVRRVLYNLDADKLKGTVVGVPIVNLQGFHRSSRYLSDRRDLNRYFPGDPGGSSASRIAHSFFHEVIKHCSAVVDLHTGSFYRTNLPQLRGDLRNPQVVKLTESFGSTVVLHSEGSAGTLRRAAVEAGIPAVTLEAGAPMVLSEDSVSHSVKGIRTLLNHLDMVSKFSLWGDPEPVYYNSTWQRAPEGGIVFSSVSLGQVVRKGDLLGTVTNPITNVRTEIRSSYNGRILGMALNQVVQPGFATHHIGIQAPQEQISAPEDVPVAPTGEPEAGAPAIDTPDAGPEPPPASAEDEDFEADPAPADAIEDDMAAAEE